MSRHATVARFDPVERTGAVLLDDGTELAFDAAAFAAGGLRLTRVGQRVRIAFAAGDDLRIVSLTIATLPDPAG